MSVTPRIAPGERADVGVLNWAFAQASGLVTGTTCLLYTSDAADERSSVDLGGRRIIKKNTRAEVMSAGHVHYKKRKSKES